MRRFGSTRSIQIASGNSSALRTKLRPPHRNRFFAVCWVMVEAPRASPSSSASSIAACSSPQSMPRWRAELGVLGGDHGFRQHRRDALERHLSALDPRALDPAPQHQRRDRIEDRDRAAPAHRAAAAPPARARSAPRTIRTSGRGGTLPAWGGWHLSSRPVKHKSARTAGSHGQESNARTVDRPHGARPCAAVVRHRAGLHRLFRAARLLAGGDPRAGRLGRRRGALSRRGRRDDGALAGRRDPQALRTRRTKARSR